MLYKEVHDQKQLKGRANDAVAAACLFISCRQEEVPRSFKEICAVSRHSKKEIGRCYKLIRLVTDQAAVPAASTSDFMVTALRMLILLAVSLITCGGWWDCSPVGDRYCRGLATVMGN